MADLHPTSGEGTPSLEGASFNESSAPKSKAEEFRSLLAGQDKSTGMSVLDTDALATSLASGKVEAADLSTHFLSEEQQMILQAIFETARQTSPTDLLEMDKAQSFCKAQLSELHELGMMNLSLPESLGGGGQSFTTEALAVIATAEVDAGLAAAYAANPLALKPILLAGTEEQKERLVKPLLESGGLAAYCQTEPEAGSDFSALRSNLSETEGGFLLNGTKIWATNGAVADLLIVACRMKGAEGAGGICVAAVPIESAGVTVVGSEDKLGQRLSNAASLAFEDVFVPTENIIAGPGEGYKLLLKTLSMARPNVAAISLGIMRRAIKLAFDAVKEREQFGAPITENQGVQFPLAEAWAKYKSGLFLTLQATKAHDLGLADAAELSSIAKLQCSEDARWVTNAMQDLHGGTGYSNEAEVSKLVRDAAVLPVYEGTSNMQKMILYRALAKELS